MENQTAKCPAKFKNGSDCTHKGSPEHSGYCGIHKKQANKPDAGQMTLCHWLDYYAQLRQYKDGLENRFISLIFRQAVASFAAVTIIVTMHEKNISVEAILLVMSIVIIGMLFYLLLTIKYFKQAGEVGKIMATIEEINLGLSEKIGVKRLLCGDPKLSIFTQTTFFANTSKWIKLYSIALIGIVFSTALIPVIERDTRSKAPDPAKEIKIRVDDEMHNKSLKRDG